MRFSSWSEDTVRDIVVVTIMTYIVAVCARAVDGVRLLFVGGGGRRGVEVDVGMGSDMASLYGLGDFCYH